jgi:hypothetical protein
MEKHLIAFFWRVCVILMVFASTAITANAQTLLNPGFELVTANVTNVFDDGNGNIVSNRPPLLWTANNLAFRTGTNSPASGTYLDPDFGHVYSGINSSASPTTARSGAFSGRVFGPFDLLCCGKSSLSYTHTSGVAVRQIWVLKGYGLNWSGDPLTNEDGFATIDQNFGLLQIEFLDAASNIITTVDGPHLLADTPLDTWISCSVTGTAPFGTTQIRFLAAHVGKQGALGSIFWDDLSITNIGLAPLPTRPPLEPAGIQAGVQVCWPTVVGTSYQPQYSDDNSNWVNIIPASAAQQMLPGDGTTNCIFSAAHKFYRVLQTVGTDASLSNPGFETAGSNYVYAGITNVSASGWTQFNFGFRSGTNNTQFGITAHNNSGFSLQTYGPFGPDLDASGAYQDLPASAGQNWRLTGYCLNWQNDKLNGSNGFGVAQLQFLDNTGGTGNVLQVVEGPRFGTDAPAPLDTWQFFEVDATNAPSGTTKVRAQVMHVGMIGDGGSLFWDDLAVYQPIGAPSPTTPTTQPAVQIYWPTSVPSNAINYQVQSSTNVAFPEPIVEGNVLVNGGFEVDAVSNAADTATITGWQNANGGSKTVSSSPKPTHSGIGALRLSDSTTAVPVVWQGRPSDLNPHPVTPGQVWDLSGFAFVWSQDNPLQGNAFGTLKIIWNDASGNLIQPLTSDTNAIGTIVTGQNAGIESTHITGGTLDQWLRIQARATAPPGAAYVQAMALLVGFPPGGAIRFDDLALTTNLYTQTVQPLGPIFPGNGHTNQVFDPIGSTQQKFYRVFTP